MLDLGPHRGPPVALSGRSARLGSNIVPPGTFRDPRRENDPESSCAEGHQSEMLPVGHRRVIWRHLRLVSACSKQNPRRDGSTTAMPDSVPIWTHRPRRGVVLASTVVVLASLLSACGGSTKTVSGPSTTPASTAASSSFESCMTKQGIPAATASRMAQRGGGIRGGFGPGRPSGSGGGSAPPGSVPGGPAGASAPSLPAGVTQAQLRAALQSCRNLLPNRGRAGGGLFTTPAGAAYRNCLTLHGVTIPARSGSATSTSATSTSGGTSTTMSSTTVPAGGGALRGLNPSDPKVAAALAACAALRPTRNGTTTTTTATGP